MRLIARPIYRILVLLSLVSLSVSPLLGQGADIILKSEEVRSQFPEGILFEAVAETAVPAQIKEIKLEMRVQGSNRGSYAYLKFEPATVVEGEYLLRTSGAQYKPPGTLIEYRYIITDSEKRTLETEARAYLYLDSRFEWSSVSDNLVAVYYYGPTKTRAELILKAAAKAIDKVGRLLDIKLAEPVRIIAYNNAADLIPAQPFESKASERELLLEGVTFPEYGTLLMISGIDRPDGVASHEMTHFLAGELTKNALVDIPAWFSEGLAEYGTINRDSTYDSRLSQAIAQERLLALRNMQNPPGISGERLLMYGQGYAVVKYMIETYGEDKFRQLFAAFNKGLPIDEALQSVYGFDQDGLDNAWRRSLGLPPVAKLEPTPTEAVPEVEDEKGQSNPTVLIVIVAAVVVVALLLGLLLRRRAHSGSG